MIEELIMLLLHSKNRKITCHLENLFQFFETLSAQNQFMWLDLPPLIKGAGDRTL